MGGDPAPRWPDGLAEELAACWDADHGDRRTELVLIGQELDHEAAREQLESCLLTAKEMACGEESWLALEGGQARRRRRGALPAR